MKCSIHSDREAAGCCAYCGKPFCEDCLVEFKGRMFCKSDLEKAMERWTQQATQKVVSAKSGGYAASEEQKINIVINNENNAVQNQSVVSMGEAPIVTKRFKFFTAFLFWLFGCGVGAHQFYVGKTGMGILYLFTGGVCGILPLIDIITMFTCSFTDCYGNTLEGTEHDKNVALIILLIPFVLIFLISMFAGLASSM